MRHRGRREVRGRQHHRLHLPVSGFTNSAHRVPERAARNHQRQLIQGQIQHAHFRKWWWGLTLPFALLLAPSECVKKRRLSLARSALFAPSWIIHLHFCQQRLQNYYSCIAFDRSEGLFLANFTSALPKDFYLLATFSSAAAYCHPDVIWGDAQSKVKRTTLFFSGEQTRKVVCASWITDIYELSCLPDYYYFSSFLPQLYDSRNIRNFTASNYI